MQKNKYNLKAWMDLDRIVKKKGIKFELKVYLKKTIINKYTIISKLFQNELYDIQMKLARLPA